MFIYLILLLLSLLILFLILYWIYRIIRLFQKKKIKRGVIQLLILSLLILGAAWELRIIPLSADYDFRNETKDLTGKQFWCWNNYRYNEFGVRGEGFTIEIYRLNSQMADYFNNPPNEFFEYYPKKKFETTKWKMTPIPDSGGEILDFITPIYGNWSESKQKEIGEQYQIVNEVVLNPGSYYSIKNQEGSVDLYLISPKKRVIIYINHNM